MSPAFHFSPTPTRPTVPTSTFPQPDEQLADETYEQFEERILNKRTVHMLHTIRTPLECGRRVVFSDLARNCNRKQVGGAMAARCPIRCGECPCRSVFRPAASALPPPQVAQKFYTFLVLKKQQAVELSQDGPYAELYIERGPKFEQSL